MSKVYSRVRKKYVLQYRNKQGKWVDVKCDYNGTYLSDLGGCIGNKSKPSKKAMEKAMKHVNDFAVNNYRVIERTILFIENK